MADKPAPPCPASSKGIPPGSARGGKGLLDTAERQDVRGGSFGLPASGGHAAVSPADWRQQSVAPWKRGPAACSSPGPEAILAPDSTQAGPGVTGASLEVPSMNVLPPARGRSRPPSCYAPSEWPGWRSVPGQPRGSPPVMAAIAELRGRGPWRKVFQGTRWISPGSRQSSASRHPACELLVSPGRTPSPGSFSTKPPGLGSSRRDRLPEIPGA